VGLIEELYLPPNAQEEGGCKAQKQRLVNGSDKTGSLADAAGALKA